VGETDPTVWLTKGLTFVRISNDGLNSITVYVLEVDRMAGIVFYKVKDAPEEVVVGSGSL
jgi:hypothetical protein